MSSGTRTPRGRRKSSESDNSAITPGKSTPAKGKLRSRRVRGKTGVETPVGKDGGGDSAGGGTGDSGSAPPASSSKKLKIFHYFSGSETSTPTLKRQGGAIGAESRSNEASDLGGNALGASGTRGSAGKSSRKRPRGTDAPTAGAKSPAPRLAWPAEAPETAPTLSGAPSWGKIVDPRKQRRWELLRRLQGESSHRNGGGAVDPTAWARRSYSLNYAPVFQDGRTPGLGSTTGTWGWASQSHVFGGVRACLTRDPLPDSANDAVREDSVEEASQDQSTSHSSGRNATDAGVADRSNLSEENDGGSSVGGEDKAPMMKRKIIGEDRCWNLQSRNFKTMYTWLSSCHTNASADVSHSAYSSLEKASATNLVIEESNPPKNLLQVTLERRDGGLAAAFMTLASLSPEALGQSAAEMEQGEQAEPGSGRDPVALALRMYHAGPTWRRMSRLPAARRPGQGRGSRLHPNDVALADEVDREDDLQRERRACEQYEAGLALLNTDVAVSLVEAVGRNAGHGSGCDSGGGISSGQDGCRGSERGECTRPQFLSALALAEVLTAAETRALAKALGVMLPSTARGPVDSSVPRANGSSSVGRTARSPGGFTDSKEEACQALEQWLTRPLDATKRQARMARALREVARVVDPAGGRGTSRSGKGKKSGSEASATNDSNLGDSVLILRLADDAREAIHRVHVAFFAAARHGLHDVPVILREELTRVNFAGAGDRAQSCRGRDGSKGEGQRLATTEFRSSVPQILSSIEAFAEFYRLVTLADAMDLAAGAGDSGLAYCSLHEASTALLPSGCPVCRSHRPQEMRGGSAGAVIDVNDENSIAKSPQQPPLPSIPVPHCDVCELSARVVMRGVGLMERDKDYDSAFHYLEILLKALSQRLSVQRPRYWLRMVTDLGHKKRTMEALRSCEKALAEAEPLGLSQGHRITISKNASTSASETSKNTAHHPEGLTGEVAVASPVPVPSSSGLLTVTNATVTEETTAADEATSAATAVFALGESLPLIRRAVRLAVPPLRWRKRPPPEIREARVQVMKLDLSWRRTGGGNAGGRRSPPSTPRSHASTKHVPARSELENETPGADHVMSGEEDNDDDNKDERGVHGDEGRSWVREGGEDIVGEDVTRSATIAVGTSLEQAVLDTMLADLGPEWTGLHAENSICLGLFALLCWDAIFMPAVTRSVSPTIFGGSPGAEDLERAKRSPGSGVLQTGEGSDGRKTFNLTDQPHEVYLSNESIPRLGRRASPPPEEDVFFPFPSPFQSEPADLMTTTFAGRRRECLESIFACVEQGGAAGILRRNWSLHYGKACTGLNWNLFADGVDGWVTVASAIGKLPLSRICRNLCCNYWAWRHGLPDLFLWRKDAAARARKTVASDSDGATKDTVRTGSNAVESDVSEAESTKLNVAVAKETDKANGIENGGTSPSKREDTVPVFSRGVGTAEFEDLTSPDLRRAETAAKGGCGAIATDGRDDHGISVGDAGRLSKQVEENCKWVEVKGPGDSLSCAQEAWIDSLVRSGAEAVLLRVVDTNAPAAALTPSPR